MARVFPSILVPGIIEHLDAQTAKKLGLLWSCVKDFQKLKHFIVLELQPVLLDAEEQQAKNHEIKDWLEKLTYILYEVDDLLDDLSNKALRKELMTRNKKAKQVCIFFSKSNQLAFNRRMGPKIKTILNNLDHIANDMRKFHFEKRHGKIPVEEKRERDDNVFCPEEVLIGRDKDKKAVVDFLMDSNVKENVSILPIVGTGGMGKTALAQFAFNHERIQKHFRLKMWVHVFASHDEYVDMETIRRKIIKSVTKVFGKKYLLVLDDVRPMNLESWVELRRLLIDGARGSKVLVTTRKKEVANFMRTVEPYDLRGLDEDDSWYLFKRMAFKTGQEPNNETIFVNMGKEIVSKCEGLPLIIITIGRLLYFKKSETEWSSFMNNELSRIRLDAEKYILATLELIYDQLPEHLKQCFACSSLFPKNYEIDKSTLINLWIAQGFIKSSNEDECLEDAGHEYLMGLISRFFFEKVTTDWSGEVTSFKMNGLMHDLATLIAGPSVTRSEKGLKKSTRHIWDTLPYMTPIVFPNLRVSSVPAAKYCRIRTFLSPSDGEPRLPNICRPFDAYVLSFKTLRALQLGSIRVDLKSSSFHKLNSLRYLDLSGRNLMKKLPDSITSLQNLQTLKLCNCSWLEEWPRDFSRLVNLRHLDINGCLKLTYMPRGLGQLTELRSLSDFLVSPRDSDLNIHSAGLNELNGLNYLRGDLQIRNLGCGKDDARDYEAAKLCEKPKFRSLKLYWDDSFGLRDDADAEKNLASLVPHRNLKRLELRGYKGATFPKDRLLALANLVEFQLSKCIKLQCLPPLSHLHSLKRLFLKDLDDIEYIMSDNDYGNESSPSLSVPASLEKLQLHYCPNLKGWWTKEPRFLPSFPCLSELSVSGCTELDSMPTFPRLEEELVLSNVRWKPMQMTMTMLPAIDPSTSASSSFAPLSKLKRLRLYRIADLKILPEEGLRNLTSLDSLLILYCHNLRSLSRGIQYLTTLQELRIRHCHNLYIGDNDEAGMGWQGLNSLLSLDFVGLPKLVSLPSCLQHVTTLKMLQISGCSMLKAVPEWIRNWTSLQEFEISNCLNLTSLPEGIRLLESLRMLKIGQHCPLLLPRCEALTGEDWLKIAHIPELYLDRSSKPKEEVMENAGTKFNVYYNYMGRDKKSTISGKNNKKVEGEN